MGKSAIGLIIMIALLLWLTPARDEHHHTRKTIYYANGVRSFDMTMCGDSMLVKSDGTHGRIDDEYRMFLLDKPESGE